MKDNEAGQLVTVTADSVEVVVPSEERVGRSGQSEMVEGCRIEVMVPVEGIAAWAKETKSGRAMRKSVYLMVQRKDLDNSWTQEAVMERENAGFNREAHSAAHVCTVRSQANIANVDPNNT